MGKSELMHWGRGHWRPLSLSVGILPVLKERRERGSGQTRPCRGSLVESTAISDRRTGSGA